MLHRQEVVSLRLTCSLTSVATKAQGSRNDSVLQLEVMPEQVEAQALQDVLPHVKASPVRSSQERPKVFGEQEAEICWDASQGVLWLRWVDSNSEPWELTEQVMKHLLLQAIQIQIAERESM